MQAARDFFSAFALYLSATSTMASSDTLPACRLEIAAGRKALKRVHTERSAYFGSRSLEVLFEEEARAIRSVKL
jgi:hypothetical protein